MEFHLREGLLLPYSREDVFPFFASAENLDTLTPPWLHFSITTPLPIVMAAGPEPATGSDSTGILIPLETFA